jgi:hypothetical protein
MTDEANKRIGDYQILDELGSGGMGRVWRVRNVLTDRIEAMKVLLPDLAGRQELAARFQREIKLMASLNHPNIAALRTAFTADNQLYMVMEYVEGTTMADKLEKGPIAVNEAVNYISQVLSAVSYAHQQHIIHRDIKPANMMLTPQGVIKLMDFGIARAGEERSLTMTGTTMGSLSYMSPEQVKGEARSAERNYSHGYCQGAGAAFPDGRCLPQRSEFRAGCRFARARRARRDHGGLDEASAQYSGCARGNSSPPGFRSGCGFEGCQDAGRDAGSHATARPGQWSSGLVHDAGSADCAGGAGGRWNLCAPDQQDACESAGCRRDGPERRRSGRSPAQSAGAFRSFGCRRDDSRLHATASRPGCDHCLAGQLECDAIASFIYRDFSGSASGTQRFDRDQAQPFPCQEAAIPEQRHVRGCRRVAARR